MNNSLIASENVSLEIEQKVDNSEFLRQREKEVLEIADALKRIIESKYWKTLEDRVFQPNMVRLSERLRKEKNPTEMYRLQGRIEEAEKVSKLSNQLQVYLNELQTIRSNLNE